MTPHSPVLITDCSSRIGAAAALRLVDSGHTVYAAARGSSSLAALARAGAVIRDLDIADEESTCAVVDEIVHKHGRIGALVNNASCGAAEHARPDVVRRHFDTAVFGMARMVQLVLPSMRAAGSGRIVTTSSTHGKLTFPLASYYQASKHAVETMLDGLRLEVRPFGITVSYVESELAATGVADAATSKTWSGPPHHEPVVPLDDSSGNRLTASGAEAMAKAIQHAVIARHPRGRYVVASTARSLTTIRALGPRKGVDRAVSDVFGM